MPKVGFELGTSQILDATVIWGSIPDSNPGEGNSIFFMSEKLLIFPTVEQQDGKSFFQNLIQGPKIS